jgi:endonuclease/exonuclease/phosphatase family metal-dependent hydrolase
VGQDVSVSELRVMSWNVHGSAGPNAVDVAARIRAAEVDVVGVQEIRRNQARAVATALGWQHVWARKHFPYGPVWWLAEGMSIMSPHVLAGHQHFVLNRGASVWSHRRRIMQRVWLMRPDGGRLRVYNTHLASHADAAERAAQATVVAGRLAEDRLAVATGERFDCVLTGDLNAREEPTTLAPLLGAGLHDTWPPTSGPGYTSNTKNPHQRIDYVLATETFLTTEATVPPTDVHWQALSDHLPVIVALSQAV